jgi:aminopeptidase N
LLAFIVGDLGFIETKTAAGVPVRVYAPSGMEKDGKFSLDLAAKTLDFFGKEFGSPYPLPKMDMVPPLPPKNNPKMY